MSKYRGHENVTHLTEHAVLSGMSSRSFKQNFSHHSLVFVIQEMTVEDRHSPYYRVCKIHNHVDGAAVGNIDRVQPQWVDNGLVVFSVREEMHLVDMHGV